MRLFRGTIDALADAIESDSDPLEAIDTSVGWATLLRVRHEVEAIAETADRDPLTLAADRYATLRKFAPALIEALEFRARAWKCTHTRCNTSAGRSQSIRKTRRAA